MRKLQVFGIGCPKCKQLATNVERAAEALNIPYELEKVTDVREIARAGVMVTPALGIDGAVTATGSVPGVEDIKRMLEPQTQPKREGS
ncbi:MAG: thioredoxin family protein [Planctomycetota bacterium]|jgi:small redox-active disulfide protein 2